MREQSRTYMTAVTAILFLSLCVPATAEDGVRNRLRGGANLYGLFGSFGFPQSINRSEGDIQIATIGIRWSHLWSLRGKGAGRGYPAFAVELMPAMAFFQEPGAWAGGINLLYEHHFASDGRVLPTWRIGAGALYADRKVPPGETRTNYSLLTGLSLGFPVTEGGVLELEYRFHHVSNADTGFRNRGINAHTVMVAYTFFR